MVRDQQEMRDDYVPFMVEKLESVALELEWSGVSHGEGSGFMGSGGDGYPCRCCPMCQGIDPSDEQGRMEFVPSAIGHRDDCRLNDALRESR
jgi:hypothetical protein